MFKLRRIFWLLILIAAAATLNADLPRELFHKPHAMIRDSDIATRADSLTGFDVQKYEITLSINDSTHQISGNVLATVLAEENLTSLPYDLVGLTVSSVLVNGSTATYTHQGGIVDIDLNIPAGQTFTTQIFYSGVPQLSPDIYHIGMIFSGNTVFTISDPDAGRYWWPSYDHPWDKALVDLHITMRGDWKVAANGIRDSIVDNGDGTKTTHWLGENPMTTYLVCITAGPYVEINQTAGTIPIQSFVMQNQYNNALIDFQNVPAMIDYYSQIFGPYPFEKYGHGVVSMSTYGAMEHQTMTTLGNFIITGTGAYELIIAHELAHQWYGDAVSFLTFKDVWLSEGFATYSEHLWTDKTQGWQAAVNYVASSYHQYYLNWVAGAGPQTIYNPGFNNYFAPPSYEKAASVLHMLRLKIGNASFFQLLQQWFSTYEHGNTVTTEFRDLAEQISGQDLDQFFNQWIFSPGLPSLEYSVWNNDASDSPLKIIAKTSSNTATQFELEVPFRFSYGAYTDSLYVRADPDGYINHFFPSWQQGAQITPNYNSWTLLRTITELKPSLVECLPTNGAVLLSWEPFLNDYSLGYNVYRRVLNGVPEWQLLNANPLNALDYTDLTAENGTEYQYAVAAVDGGGWISMTSNIMQATPVSFNFSNDLLVVDETRDGTGANINPDDTMVDDFYAAALSPLVHDNWDFITQGMPSLAQLGDYRLVLWHADDFNQNLLVDHLNTLGGYILGGGKVLLSGWKTPSVLSLAFVERFAGGVELVYDNAACLISAESASYPDLTVDPLKLSPSWNGMLPQIYTFVGAQTSLYTANMGPSGQGDGNCAALKHQLDESAGTLVLLGFPLYYMQGDGVRGFLQQIIPELLIPVATEDLVETPVSATLSVYPNPFNPQTRIEFSLPAKGELRLELYNLKGQKVRTLFSGMQEAGTHSLVFDGRDASGNDVSSGVYLLRMESGGKQLTQRISLVK